MDRTDRHDAHLSRDAAGIGPHARPGVRLVSLGELPRFHVAEGDADIRSWEVRTVSGRELGRVSDLLVDPEAGEVVMLDVDLHGTDRHTLAPVRAAQIDRTRRVVLLDTADLQELDAVPSLRRNAAPTDEEGRQFHDRYRKAYGERGWDRDRDFQVAHGDHDLEFRRRPGEVSRQDAMLADATAQDAARRTAEAEASRERVEKEREQREKQERERQAQQQRNASLPAQPVQTEGSRALRWAQGQEEIVVERRPVIEEVIIRRRVVDPSSLQAGALGASQSGASQSGAADRATSSGPMDRAADRLDDVKDRVDGNPASRPGPDATDRPI